LGVEGDGRWRCLLRYERSAQARYLAQLVGAQPVAVHNQGAVHAERRFEDIITYLQHRVTNTPPRGSINSKIQWVKYTA